MTVLCGAPTHTTLPPVEALVRWDPLWFVARELAERVELSLPPAVRMAQLVGPRVAVRRAVEMAGLEDSVERLGPLPWVPVSRGGAGRAAAERADGAVGDGLAGAGGGTQGSVGAGGGIDPEPTIQLLLRASLDDGPALTAALARMKALRSARKEREPVSVRVDPTGGLA